MAWLEMVHPDDLRIARASNDQLKSLGYSSCEYRVLRHDGSVRWVSDRKRMIVDAHGTATMIGGIAEDITAVKERDAARALTQGELERMVDQRTAELERVNVELEAFTRTAAHDLKAPLNGIVGFSHLLQSRYGQSLGADGARMAGHIEQSAKQMATLVNDLLALSRVNSVEIDLQPVDLVPIARDILAELALHEPTRSVSFEAPSSLIAHCDPGLVRSLLANLLGNAWKFTGRTDPSRIRLSGEITERGTQVEVEDNGAGFDARHAENLFKPFQRFHSSKEFSGTGIGLATCQRIVQRHGGRLSIDSMPGAGTTVRVILPPAKRDGQPMAARAATA
jgi:signal transduction histidine kinase